MPAKVSVVADLDDGTTLNYSENADAKPTYDLEFVNQKVICHSSANASVHRVYSAELTIKKPTGETLVSDVVTCTHSQTLSP